MKIKYINTRKDLFNYQIRSIFMIKSIMISIIFVLIIFLVWSFLKMLNDGYSSIFIIGSILSQIVVFILVMAIISFILSGIIALLYKGEGILCEHTLIIDGDKFKELTDVNETIYDLSAITKVVESKKHYFILVSNTLGGAHIVPKCRNILEGNVEEFINKVKSKINKS
ncbi:MAG: YcxB family protein [Halarcobacter sp.]